MNEKINPKETHPKLLMSRQEIIEDLSPAAKELMINLGLLWRRNTGNTGSFVSHRLLQAVVKATTPWTMNSLKKSSGEGLNGIKYGLLEDLTNCQILFKVEGGRFDKYHTTPAGKEVLLAIILICDVCNNTRLCRQCNGNGVHLDEDPCSHVIVDKCESCKGTGKKDPSEPFRSKYPYNFCDECEGMEYEYIDGEYDVDSMNTDPIPSGCDECDDDRHKRCYSCNNSYTHRTNGEYGDTKSKFAGVCKWCNISDTESLLNEMDGLFENDLQEKYQ